MKRMTKLCLLALCMLWVALLPMQAQADEVDLTQIPVLSVDENGHTYFTGETQDLSVRHPQILDEGGVSTYTLGEVQQGGESDLTFTTFEDLKELASRSYGPRYTQAYYQGEDPLTISEDLTIPQYLQVVCEDTVVISQGVTLTMDGGLITPNLEVNGTLELPAEYYSTVNVLNMTINGSVNNTGYIYVDPEGKITLSDSGSYTGSGRLYFSFTPGTYQSEKEMWNDCVTGLNLVDFELSEHDIYTWGEYSWEYWIFRNNKGLTKLDAPTELKWGYDYYWDNYNQVLTEEPGTICFKGAGLNQDQWLIKVYNAENNLSLETITMGFGGMSEEYEQTYKTYDMWHAWLNASSLESGTYYYTVQTVGDYVEYCNSDVVRSENWTYEAPETKMATPTNVSRNSTTFSWDTVEGANCYVSNMRYAATEDAEPTFIHSGMMQGRCTETIPEWVWSWGSGYYYYSVHTIACILSVKTSTRHGTATGRRKLSSILIRYWMV